MEKIKQIGAVMRNYRLKAQETANKKAKRYFETGDTKNANEWAKKRDSMQVKHVAKRMGLLPQALSRLESGGAPIQLHVFLDWCDALELKPRSVIEKCYEAITGEKRQHLSKKQQKIRQARQILQKN